MLLIVGVSESSDGNKKAASGLPEGVGGETSLAPVGSGGLPAPLDDRLGPVGTLESGDRVLGFGNGLTAFLPGSLLNGLLASSRTSK